jgi:hypothetical protein
MDRYTKIQLKRRLREAKLPPLLLPAPEGDWGITGESNEPMGLKVAGIVGSHRKGMNTDNFVTKVPEGAYFRGFRRNKCSQEIPLK